MNIAISGSTGFVGSALCDHLVNDPINAPINQNRLVKLIRPNQTNWSENVSQNSADLVIPSGDSVAEYQGYFESELSKLDVIIHTAARVHIMNDEACNPLEEYRKDNVELTLRLAQHAANAGVKRFVFLSSIKVNGESTQPGQPFTSEDSFVPTDPYGLSKYEAEQGLLKIAAETGMEVVIIRPPLVYGPGVKANFESMLKWVNKGVPLPFGLVNNQRSLVALDNLVDFIMLCADREKSPKAANQVFLISDQDDVSTTVLLKRVAKSLGKSSKLLPIPVSFMRFAAAILGRAAVAERLFGSLQVDSSKATNLLGWKPVTTMQQQLEKTADAFLKYLHTK